MKRQPLAAVFLLKKCGYGIYSKAREIPIFFVSEKTINQKRLTIARGVFGDLQKLRNFTDSDRFWKLWENEFITTENLLKIEYYNETSLLQQAEKLYELSIIPQP